MKKTNLFKLVPILGILFLFSCENDKEDNAETKPAITAFSVGNEVGGTESVQLGGIISFEFDAEMKTNDKIISYYLEMHDEPASGLAADEYKIIDKEFEIGGLRNTHVHDHIEVPLEANTGNYHFHLTVTSENGYTSSKEAHLTVVDNNNAPEVSDFTVTNKSGNATINTGDTLIVSFTAKAKSGNTLKEYHLEIHDEPNSGKLEDEFKLVNKTFTADFANLSEATIQHETEVVAGGESGNYHIHLHIFDNENNGVAKVDEITIQ